MCYYDYETSKRLTEKQIEVYERLLAYVPAIKEVVQNFGGKVISKRFDAALKKAYSGASCEKSSYSGRWYLALWEWNDRSVPVESQTISGETINMCEYIEDSAIWLADSWEIGWISDDNRIDASILLKAIDAKYEYYKALVDSLKDQLSRIDEIIETYNRIRQEKEDFQRNTNSHIAKYFKFQL